jgi:60 kDa SS-A/Ro ribonucleoprotein
MTALIRNIGRMASLEIFDDERCIDILRARLTDPERLEKARVHPLHLLTAWKVYSQGHGLKGNLSWRTDTRVKDILEEAFYPEIPENYIPTLGEVPEKRQIYSFVQE